MNILNIGYDSTNYYLVEPGRAGLLVDVGWPGTLPKLLANLLKKNLALRDVRYFLATHYHPDHAGIAQEIIQHGARLVILEEQLAAVPQLRRYIKPSMGYQEIKLAGCLQLQIAQSRPFLERIGLEGEIIHTPGHSEDSVTLVLDDGSAFTGDLTPPALATEETQELIEQSWSKIRMLHVKMIYPGHGPTPVPLKP